MFFVFFLFIHVESDMLVLSLLIMYFYSPCGKNVLDFTPESCHDKIPLMLLL